MRRAGVGRACFAALWVCLGGASGCAANEAAAPAAAEPTGMKLESREPATIEEAQAQLERARAQLPGASVTPSTPTTGASVESGPGASGATIQSTTEAPQPAWDSSRANGERQRCGNACGAMVSMRHAVDAICRLAGESDPRCTDARRTLKDSETKVTGCGCPAP